MSLSKQNKVLINQTRLLTIAQFFIKCLGLGFKDRNMKIGIIKTLYRGVSKKGNPTLTWHYLLITECILPICA